MKRQSLIATLLTLGISNVQAATAYFETTADYIVEGELYNSPLIYVQELHDTLLLTSTLENPNAPSFQADFKARTIYTGSGTSPYSIVMNTSTRFVDRESERDALAYKYANHAMKGGVINAISTNNGIALPQLGIPLVNSHSGTSSFLGSNYDNLFVGGPSTTFDVTLSMSFTVGHSIDWGPMINWFHDINKQAFGPESAATNSYPLAPVAIVEDWTYNTNDGQPGLGSGESSGSYSRSFYFNSEAEAVSFGHKIKEVEDILITLSKRSIGDFAQFSATNVSTNAVPEPSSTMLGCMASLMLLGRRKR